MRRVVGNDAHAASIDVYPEAEHVSAELDEHLGADREPPTNHDALEARLLFETRAIAERRLAAAGAEHEKATRRVEPVGDPVERTLMGMSPPPPPPPEPTPMPARDETLRISIDLSSMMRTSRLRLRRARIVRALALLAFVALVAGFTLLLGARDPGFAGTRAAIAHFVQSTFVRR